MSAIQAGQTTVPEEGAATAPPSEPSQGPPPAPEPTPPPQEPVPGPGEDLDDDIKAPEIPELDDEELLEPKTTPVERVLEDRNGHKGAYLQKPLTYFGKIELYGLLGRAVEIAMAGEGGLGIDELMGFGKPKDMISQILSQLPAAETAPDAGDQDQEMDAAKMLAAFAKVISVAPEMLMEGYCIVLAIPKGHRKWAMDWGLPDGVDDEMGSDIMHTFLDQNWGVMEDFFIRELPKIFKRAAKARERHHTSGGAPSKP